MDQPWGGTQGGVKGQHVLLGPEPLSDGWDIY